MTFTLYQSHGVIFFNGANRMRFSWSRIGTTAILGLFVAATAGCTLVNKIRAKNELNETARTYKAGQFEEAEQHAKRALYLDPKNPTAPPIQTNRTKNEPKLTPYLPAKIGIVLTKLLNSPM